jgi:hypothetical protein
VAAQAGAGSHWLQVDLFSNYAFLVAQDGADPTLVDHFEWRDGHLSQVSSVRARSELSGRGYGAGDVPWARLADLMSQAVRRLHVSHPDSQYIEVDREGPGATGVVLRIFAQGPTSPGGYLVADGTGTIRSQNAD